MCTRNLIGQGDVSSLRSHIATNCTLEIALFHTRGHCPICCTSSRSVLFFLSWSFNPCQYSPLYFLKPCSLSANSLLAGSNPCSLLASVPFLFLPKHTNSLPSCSFSLSSSCNNIYSYSATSLLFQVPFLFPVLTLHSCLRTWHISFFSLHFLSPPPQLE